MTYSAPTVSWMTIAVGTSLSPIDQPRDDKAAALPPPEGTRDDQPQESAKHGLWADFAGSFANTLKGQANGFTQLTNKAGTSLGQLGMSQVDKADFGSKEWFAELAGQGAALAVEFGVLRRLGVMGTQALGLRAGEASIAETALGKTAASAGTGMLMGGVLTPSEHQDGIAFWTDRIKSAGAMTATTLTMGALAQPLGRFGNSLSKGILGDAAITAQAQSLPFALTSGEASTITSKLVDGAIRNYLPTTLAGFGGGTVGGITEAVMNGEPFDLKTAQNIGSKAIEFGIVGAGAHTVDLAVNTVAQPWTSLPKTSITPPGRLAEGVTPSPQSPSYIDFAQIEKPRTVVERRIAQSIDIDAKNQSVWYETVPGEQRFSTVKGDIRKQIAVVGAGNAGLQAAEELAKSGYDVAVVDSGVVAGKTTGAMAGMIVRIPDEGYLKLGKLYGDDATRQIVGELASAHDVILRQAQSMDTDFVPAKFYKGSNRLNTGWINRNIDYVRQFDNNVETIEGQEASQKVPGSSLVGAQLGGGNLNPRKLALGLASSGRFAVYENSPVLGMTVRGADNPVTLHTPEGTITADKVVFATGGPAAPFRYLQDKLLPAQAFAVSANHSRNLEGGFADSSGFLGMNYNYWRDVVPGRVFFGGADRALQYQSTLTAQNTTLLGRLTGRYPEAQADNQWTGTLFMNPTSGLPIVAQHPDFSNVWGVTALGGVGLVNGAFAAKVLRQQLTGATTFNMLSPENALKLNGATPPNMVADTRPVTINEQTPPLVSPPDRIPSSTIHEALDPDSPINRSRINEDGIREIRGEKVRVGEGETVIAGLYSEVIAGKGSKVIARGSYSHVTAEADSHVIAGYGSEIEALPGSFIEASDNCTVNARGGDIRAGNGAFVNATEDSFVQAEEGSRVHARDGAIVFAAKNSEVVAGQGSFVRAEDGSFIYAKQGSIVSAETGSKIEAHTGSKVVANTGSSIMARDGSTIFANDGSNVQAASGSTVHAKAGSTVVAESGSTVYASEGARVHAKPGAKILAADGAVIEPVTAELTRNPIPTGISPKDAAAALTRLSRGNEGLVRQFLWKVDENHGAYSELGYKTPSGIESKAVRPSVLASKPWFGVEHVSDGFRFRSILKDLNSLPDIVSDMNERGFAVEKVDLDKMQTPTPWGWRVASFDLRMPNGQLVEYQLPVKEMLDANEHDGHLIYERWRTRDVTQLTADEHAEYQRDMQASRDLYNQAWQSYLTRTGQTQSDVANVIAQVRSLLQP